MKSLPTVDQVNLDKYWDIVRKLDPSFYRLRVYMEETQINPNVINKIIRQLRNLVAGTKYGKVQIFMENGEITTIKGEETDLVKEYVLLTSKKKSDIRE